MPFSWKNIAALAASLKVPIMPVRAPLTAPVTLPIKLKSVAIRKSCIIYKKLFELKINTLDVNIF